nr:P-loop containing nucleoside triphosphate hydrolases superfamily protein [Ipomoea batatas]
MSTQRSGSGWFETLLNNHTNISSNGEIFSVKPRRSNISTIVDTLDKIYNLDWLTSASKNECTAAVGLKWMLNQAEILASYKPTLDTKILVPNLKQVDDMVAKSLEYFKSTRHIILYYEDIIQNKTVRNQSFSLARPSVLLFETVGVYQSINQTHSFFSAI